MATITTLLRYVLVGIFLYCLRHFWRAVQGWKFLIKGRSMMLDHARKNPGKPYALRVPGNTLHVVSSKQHWDDLNKAHADQLSPNAASREMFQSKQAFGFDWPDARMHVSIAGVRSIKNMTQRLPGLQRAFVGILEREFDEVLSKNLRGDGWARVPLYETIQRVLLRINVLWFFGEDTANDDEFIDNAMIFTNQTASIMETARLLPSWVAPLITRTIRGRGREREIVYRTILKLIVERETHNRSTPEGKRAAPTTWLEGSIDYTGSSQTTQETLNSVTVSFTTPILAIPIVTTQLLLDMYTPGQASHFPSLLAEALTVPLHSETPGNDDAISDALSNVPKLEAFAMESWRTNCFQANTAHRIAVKEFAFSDGYTVPVGEMVEFNQHALMTDSAIFANPGVFDPARFTAKSTSSTTSMVSELGKSQGNGNGNGKSDIENNTRARAITDLTNNWPFWGVPRYQCPGRFHVAGLQKLVAVYLMQRFEARLEGEGNSVRGLSLNFEWRDARVPSSRTVMLLREREGWRGRAKP